jgi:hypothetical protein
MPDATTRAMAKFDDPSLWVVDHDIPLFDAHTEPIKDADGNPTGKTITFDKALLEQYALNMNLRDEAGTPAAITIGHTTDDPNEKNQPEIVGYARGFYVAPFGPKGKLGILASKFYYFKDRYEEAKTYPRVSVERWGGKSKIMDPIALLRRTPALNVGVRMSKGTGVRYNFAGEPRVRYAMEVGMPEQYAPGGAAGVRAIWAQTDDAGERVKTKDGSAYDSDAMDGEWHKKMAAEEQANKNKQPPGVDKTIEGTASKMAAEPPAVPPPGVGEKGLSPEDQAKADQYMGHYMAKHPHMQYLAKCYAASQGPAAAPPAAAASPTNAEPIGGGGPAATPEEKVRMAAALGHLSPEVVRYMRQIEDQGQRLAATEKILNDERNARQLAEAQRITYSLASQGYHFDTDTLTRELAPLNEAGRKAVVERVQLYHKRDAGGQQPIRLFPDHVEAPQIDTAETSEEDMATALRYMRAKQSEAGRNGKQPTLEEAVKYAKELRSKKPSRTA